VDDRVCVAVSGGKDSMSLLYVLNKKKYNVTALAIDEGIGDYRDKTLKTMKNFCVKNKIPYKIVSFKKEFGKTLDKIMEQHKERPCTICGVFRRYLLNSRSCGFDVLATGHNMDDEAQAILMNLIKTNISLFHRLGPVSGYIKSRKFTKRVKPFYFCLEKEIMVYSFLNNLNSEFK
jgi:tRNA(Ile)-lysidine synthase TilS/MesJ